jgi:hypothetical protein
MRHSGLKHKDTPGSHPGWCGPRMTLSLVLYPHKLKVTRRIPRIRLAHPHNVLLSHLINIIYI